MVQVDRQSLISKGYPRLSSSSSSSRPAERFASECVRKFNVVQVDCQSLISKGYPRLNSSSSSSAKLKKNFNCLRLACVCQNPRYRDSDGAKQVVKATAELPLAVTIPSQVFNLKFLHFFNIA